MTYVAQTVCKNPECRYKDGGIWTRCRLCGWSIFAETKETQHE